MAAPRQTPRSLSSSPRKHERSPSISISRTWTNPNRFPARRNLKNRPECPQTPTSCLPYSFHKTPLSRDTTHPLKPLPSLRRYCWLSWSRWLFTCSFPLPLTDSMKSCTRINTRKRSPPSWRSSPQQHHLGPATSSKRHSALLYLAWDATLIRPLVLLVLALAL